MFPRWFKFWRRRASVSGPNKIRVGLVIELDRSSRDEHGDLEWYDQLTIMDEQMVADEVRRVVDLCVRRCNMMAKRGVVLPEKPPRK